MMRRWPGSTSNGPYSGRASGAGGRLHDEAAVEALAGAEPVGADLVADGARHAVRGLPSLLVVGGERQVREHLPSLAPQLRLVARDRHVADRALVLDRAAADFG